MKHIVGVASVTANLSWRGNTQDRQSGNSKWNQRITQLRIGVALNRKPQTHNEFIGVSDQFAGTGGAPRRRRTVRVAKSERSAKSCECAMRLGKPSTAAQNVRNMILFLIQLPLWHLGVWVKNIVGVASVTANLSWRGNTQDRQSGNSKWNQLPA